MEHLSIDHEDCPNQHKNSHKLCNETIIIIIIILDRSIAFSYKVTKGHLGVSMRKMSRL